MGKAQFEGVCVPVDGPEDCYLKFFDAEPRVLGATSIVGAAGAAPTDWSTVTAFGYLGTEHYEGTWQEYVDEYRKESGSQFPPIYRVKITVEAEPLSDAECEEYWKRDAQER